MKQAIIHVETTPCVLNDCLFEIHMIEEGLTILKNC